MLNDPADQAHPRRPGVIGVAMAAMGICLLAGCASAQAATPQIAMPQITTPLTITYSITGAVQDSGSLSHAADPAHLCAAASLPALHAVVDGAAVEAPPGPPVYMIEFDPQAPPSQPGAVFKVFGFQPGMLTHTDPADDWVQIDVKGRRWVGHGAQGAFQDHFTFDPDGLSGHLTAHALLAQGPDGALDPGQSIDLDATWTCPRP